MPFAVIKKISYTYILAQIFYLSRSPLVSHNDYFSDGGFRFWEINNWSTFGGIFAVAILRC
ncbi:hypothetical protein PL9214290347 [Planktothrix tepida PCC 9214]|uniref:Uncharacterized protein n=1 Tax=Planktothrix tepida PCC 9214 TaxID=671072 RepID=A0A1J1LFT0_9CYAN|nr:hypothetical protein PL9214290347 [Planktothrix tepida PCC 9214]